MNTHSQSSILLPYQDCDCGCAYEPEEKKWLASNPHSADCFITLAEKVVSGIEKANPVPDFNFFYMADDVDAAEFVQFWNGGPGPTEEQKERKKKKQAKYESDRKAYSAASAIRSAALKKAIIGLYKREKVTLRNDPEWAWKYQCTCGQAERHNAWAKAHEHVKPCPHWWASQPNFLYKPTGLEVRWYKYIGRDMKFNRKSLRPKEWKAIKSLVTAADIQRVIGKAEKQHEQFSAMIAHANSKMAVRES